jgi:hypothetical protein
MLPGKRYKPEESRPDRHAEGSGSDYSLAVTVMATVGFAKLLPDRFPIGKHHPWWFRRGPRSRS